MIAVKDSTIEECIAFLENCECKQEIKFLDQFTNKYKFSVHGKTVKSVICPKLYDENEDGRADGEETVTYEARKLKCILLKLQNY